MAKKENEKSLSSRFDKEMNKIEKEKEKIIKETDKAYEKTEKKRIKELNKEIKKNHGVMHINGETVYMEKQKYEKPRKPEKQNKRPNWVREKETLWQKFKRVVLKRESKQKDKIRRGARDTLLHRFIKWMKTSVLSTIVSLFHRNKDVEYDKTYEQSKPEQAKDVKAVPKDYKDFVKDVQHERESIEAPKLNQQVKQLFSSPINTNAAFIGAPQENIVEAYKEYMAKASNDELNSMYSVGGFIGSRLDNYTITTEENLADLVGFVVDEKCEFNKEANAFDISLKDKENAVIRIDSRGNITIPETFIRDGKEVENTATVDDRMANSQFAHVGHFLEQNDKIVDIVLTEQKISRESLTLVRDFIEKHPEHKEMLPIVEAIEKSEKRPEVFVMLNTAMARLSYIDNIDSKDMMQYGFEKPIDTVLKMKNPADFKIYIAAMQSGLLAEQPIDRASLYASSFIVDSKDPIEAVTDMDKVNLIRGHLSEMLNNRIPLEQATAVVKSYNHCQDEVAIKIAIAKVENQMQNGASVAQVINIPHIEKFDAKAMAESIANEMNGKTIADLQQSYRNNELNDINIAIKALSADELSTITKHLSAENIDKFNAIADMTREEHTSSIGDDVLSDNPTYGQLTSGENRNENELMTKLPDVDKSTPNDDGPVF